MRRPVLTEYHITTEYPIERPVRIAQVSDLHERKAADIMELLRAAEPDIIVVTGDTYERYDNRPQYDFENKPVKKLIITSIHNTNAFLRRFESTERMALDEYADGFLREAAAIAPVYMSLGNHEQRLFDRDYEFIRESGVILLDNESIQTEVGGLRMNIGGMSSWEFEDFIGDFAKLRGFKLLLCHHPERFVKYALDTDIDLTLSGHTHGGQLRIGRKGRGFFVPGQGICGRYAHGSFFGGRLIVSAGCSNTVACPRMFNPRELVVVTVEGR